MEVFSPFIQELDSAPYLPGDVDYAAVVSNQDEIVLPGVNGFLRGAINLNVNLLGHGGILFNEAVYQMARHAIDYDITENHDAIPIEIVKSSMTTNRASVTLKIKKCNHYKPDASIRKMKISNNSFLHGSDWESFADTKLWNLDSDGDGLKAVYVQFKDGRNFLFPDESPVYVDYIFYDTHKPTGNINIIPDVTLESSVPIHINAEDNSDNYKTLKGWNFLTSFGIADLGVKEMIVSTQSNFAGASWQPYSADTTVALGAGSGQKTVYVKVRDGAGNESAVMTDTVRVIDPNSGDIGMVSESAKQPVVLVHGWGGSMLGDVSVYVNWVYIYEKLKSDGFDVYRVTLSEGGLQDVKKSAAELQAFIADVRSKTGAARVDVVCHSEGGLVARYFIKNLGGAQFVDDLVTISTPHRGTIVATIGPGEASRQMEVGNSFLQELNGGDALPGDVSYTALFSHGDEVVVPGKNGFFDGAININYLTFGHAGILFAPEPYAVVKNALGYKYLFPKNIRPVEIKEAGMVTKSNRLEIALRRCNHYAPQTPITEMIVSADPQFAGASWQPAAPSVLLDVSGAKNGLLGVFAKFRGADGVESPSYPDYIVIDREAPKGEISIAQTPQAGVFKVKLQIKVSDNSERYGKLNATNALEAYGILGIGAKEMMISNSADFAGAAWQAVAETLDWSVPQGAGNKTIYAKFRDAAGNESTPVSTSVYIFDLVNGYTAREDKKDPVIFIHGYMGSIIGDVSSYINWVYYVEKLKAEGYSTHVITLGGAAMQDIKVSAKELKDFVDKVLAETSAQQVDLVCHSEGGLVARYYVQFLGGMFNVDDLIAISSPHRGLMISAIAPGEAGRQMEIGADFLKLLNGSNYLSGNVNYTAIFSNDDGTVVPAENAFLAGALNINFNNYTHATILFNDEVFNVVKNALSLDIGRGGDELPVYIAKTQMVTSNPNVSLKLNYYNHNAPLYPGSEMMISNDKLFRGASWRTISNTVNWNLDSSSDGLKAVYVKFKAKDSGIESPAYVDYIFLDRTPPSGAVMATLRQDDLDTADLILSAGDNADDQTKLNPLKLTTSFGIQGIGLTEMMIWNNADFVGATWEPYAPKKVWALPKSDAPRTVYVKFKDAAGNISDVTSATVTKPGVPAAQTTDTGAPAAGSSVSSATETVAEVIADITADIKFDSGWNLIYVPDILPDDARRMIVGLLDSTATIFDLAANDTKTAAQAWSAGGGRAIWQNLASPFSHQLKFKGRVAARGTNRSILLDQGWNIIGVSSYEPVAASALSVSIGNETLDIKSAAQQGWLDGRILGYSDGKYSDTDQLLPFRAYFIKVYRPCLINIP